MPTGSSAVRYVNVAWSLLDNHSMTPRTIGNVAFLAHLLLAID